MLDTVATAPRIPAPAVAVRDGGPVQLNRWERDALEAPRRMLDPFEAPSRPTVTGSLDSGAGLLTALAVVMPEGEPVVGGRDASGVLTVTIVGPGAFAWAAPIVPVVNTAGAKVGVMMPAPQDAASQIVVLDAPDAGTRSLLRAGLLQLSADATITRPPDEITRRPLTGGNLRVLLHGEGSIVLHCVALRPTAGGGSGVIAIGNQAGTFRPARPVGLDPDRLDRLRSAFR